MDFLLHLLSYWDSALAVILVFGGLIFFHELGHFIANKMLGVGVITFSIGMGPKLFGFKYGKTEYRLSLLPIGGFVSAVGEYDHETESLGFSKEEALYLRPAWQRMLMAFAGPFANFVVAFVIYFGLCLTTGVSVSLPQISDPLPDSPAWAAGLRKGDTINSINGMPVSEWAQIPDMVSASGGKELTLKVTRENAGITLSLTPQRMTRTTIFGEEEEAWLIGVSPLGTVRHIPVGFGDAIREGLGQTARMTMLTWTGFKKLLTGRVSAKNVGGPVMIAEMLGSQAKVGMVPLLLLAALISVNLGLLNLLPVPVLDGGVILFGLVEMLIRRPVPEKLQNILLYIGVFLLVALMVFATFNDILRLFK